MPRRVAFVPPRFGPGVVGGSEAVVRETARGIAARGWDVEVLTTCAVNHYTWENELPPGAREEDGVLVRRFPTTFYPSRVMTRVQLAVQSGQPVSLDDQLGWISSRFTVPDLFQHLLRYGTDYDVVVFSPYLFWTATACLPVVKERAVVIPCLHDEHYARLDIVRPVLTDPASVWFLSEPEHELAHRLGPVASHHRVTGAGVDVPAGYDPAGFVARHHLRRPFVLFAGRREADKGWDWLLDTYRGAVARGGIDLDLVTIGVGEVTIPPDLTGRVIDLGFLSDAERDDAVAAAAAYIQPSRMESFSRAVMEAWLAGTPVLAVDSGTVVAWHCERSGGGLTFGNAEELSAALRWIAAEPEQASAMAVRGRDYVLAEYAWPVVLDRMEADLATVATRPVAR